MTVRGSSVVCPTEPIYLMKEPIEYDDLGPEDHLNGAEQTTSDGEPRPLPNITAWAVRNGGPRTTTIHDSIARRAYTIDLLLSAVCGVPFVGTPDFRHPLLKVETLAPQLSGTIRHKWFKFINKHREDLESSYAVSRRRDLRNIRYSDKTRRFYDLARQKVIYPRFKMGGSPSLSAKEVEFLENDHDWDLTPDYHGIHRNQLHDPRYRSYYLAPWALDGVRPKAIQAKDHIRTKSDWVEDNSFYWATLPLEERLDMTLGKEGRDWRRIPGAESYAFNDMGYVYRVGAAPNGRERFPMANIKEENRNATTGTIPFPIVEKPVGSIQTCVTLTIPVDDVEAHEARKACWPEGDPFWSYIELPDEMRIQKPVVGFSEESGPYSTDQSEPLPVKRPKAAMFGENPKTIVRPVSIHRLWLATWGPEVPFPRHDIPNTIVEGEWRTLPRGRPFGSVDRSPRAARCSIS